MNENVLYFRVGFFGHGKKYFDAVDKLLLLILILYSNSEVLVKCELSSCD